MALPGNKNFSDYDNYITDQNPTTSAQAQDYFRNQAELLKAVIDCDFWQPETVYQPGDVVKSDSMPNGTEAVMVATKASVTSNVEPQWGAVGGANISDGACFWKLRKRLATVNGIEADAKGNVQIPVMQGSNENAGGADGLVPAPPATSNELFLSNEGEWKEAGKVKSVNGKTGDVVVDLPVGHMYFSIEPNVPAGRLPAMGATYNRALYADLWNWANSVGLVKSESEWQAQASANDGNCAFYSDGDGSTTFRVPSIKCWVKGADGEEVGSYSEAGLPNIEGSVKTRRYGESAIETFGYAQGAFKAGDKADWNVSTTFRAIDKSNTGEYLRFNASLSNPIYGNSDTVQPPSIVGMWLIVAYGTVTNVGNADVGNVMQAVEQVQTGLGTLEQGVGTAIDYIVESYRNGTEWYEVYKSGKVRQGGKGTGGTSKSGASVAFLLPFANAKYSVVGQIFKYADLVNAIPLAVVGVRKTTTGFTASTMYGGSSYDFEAFQFDWVAEGQGA